MLTVTVCRQLASVLYFELKAIQAIPVLINTKQLLRLVCTASYYLKFVPKFAEICEPLRQLLKADTV